MCWVHARPDATPVADDQSVRYRSYEQLVGEAMRAASSSSCALPKPAVPLCEGAGPQPAAAVGVDLVSAAVMSNAMASPRSITLRPAVSGAELVANGYASHLDIHVD